MGRRLRTSAVENFDFDQSRNEQMMIVRPCQGGLEIISCTNLVTRFPSNGASLKLDADDVGRHLVAVINPDVILPG